MKKLIPLYESILSTAGMSADKDGFISAKAGGVEGIVTIKGKRLVLPTRHQLTMDDDNRVIFHPLHEHAMRGESPVVEKLRSMLVLRLNWTMGWLASQLLTLAASPAEHAKFNPDQTEFLKQVKMIDEKFIEEKGAFERLRKSMPLSDPSQNFISIFLKRGGVIAGKKHSRIGVVSFPLYEELKKDGLVFGVKMRGKDREILMSFLQYVFPKIDEKDAYNRGSDSDIAPFTEALMRTFAAVADPITDVVETFRKLLDKPDEMIFNSDWMESLDNLGALLPEIRLIPAQAGNEGPVLSKGLGPAAETPAPAPTHMPAATAGREPVFPSAPVPTHAPAPQPYPTPAPQHHPQAAPPYGYGYPQQPQHQPPQPPRLQKSEHGLDFNSVIAANPILGSLPGYGSSQFYPQPVVQERMPRWAQPNQPGWNQPPGMQQPQGYNPQQPAYLMNPGMPQRRL